MAENPWQLYGITMRVSPEIIGMDRLSLIGDGMLSTIMPIAEAIMALNGVVNRVAPKKENRNPKIVPSSFFDLLKGRIIPPKSFQRSAQPHLRG